MTPSAPLPFSLHGKAALVTGAGSGIGRAIAARFALALYLAADESAMVTGSAYSIDGGWTAGK